MLTTIECVKCKHQTSYFERFGDLTLDLTNPKSTQELYKKRT